MKNLFRKLHTSEVLLLAAYAVLLYSFFLIEENAGEDVNLSFFTSVGIVVLSFWSVWRLKAISPVLYPFYVLLGYGIGSLFANGIGGSGPGAAIGLFIGMALIGLICMELICGIVFATKDAYKMLILITLSFIVVFALDKTFITSKEINAGEKGSSYYLDEYPDWRVLEEAESL